MPRVQRLLGPQAKGATQNDLSAVDRDRSLLLRSRRVRGQPWRAASAVASRASQSDQPRTHNVKPPSTSWSAGAFLSPSYRRARFLAGLRALPTAAFAATGGPPNNSAFSGPRVFTKGARLSVTFDAFPG